MAETVPQPGIIIGNSLKDSPMDPLVPEYLEITADLVQKYLDQSSDFATDAVAAAMDTIAELAAGSMPGNIPNPPSVQTVSVTGDVSAGLNYDNLPSLGSVVTSDVAPFVPDEIPLVDVSGEIPVYVPVITGVSIPDAPTAASVTMPAVPVIDTTFNVPAAPVSSYGESPVLVEYTLPVYIPPVIPVFTDPVPTFSELPPDPAIQWVEPVYTSAIKTQVEGVLGTMLAGGTGLPAAVERAIWERGREREDDAAEQQVHAALTQWTTRGFSHPPGQLNGQIIVLRDMTGRKVNELSREVMTKQADLEQKNRQFAVQSGIDYERVFTALFMQIVDRNFQIAKFGVESQIQIYNLLVNAFNVEQQIFAQQVLLHRTKIETAFADIKAFEAQVGAVKAGSELNIALVQSFGEKVKAYSAEVDAYNSTVKAESAKADLQKNRVELYKAEVEGAVAQIQAQRDVYLAYDAKIRGETAKVNLEEANTKAYTARVQAIGEKAQILIKEADLQLSADKLRLDWNVANMQRITTLNGQQVAVIQGNLANFQAINAKAISQYDADLKGKQVTLQSQIELGKLQLARYQTVSDQWKAQVQHVIQMAEINANSLRSAGQIAGTLAAGAMAATHVSAGLSSQTGASQTSSRQSADHTNHSEQYNSTYAVNHNYSHKA